MACAPARVDNARALASGLSYVQVDIHGNRVDYLTSGHTWYNYFIAAISV